MNKLPELTLNKRNIIVYKHDSLGGREYKNCTQIQYCDDGSILVTFDYEEHGSSCVSYNKIRIDNVEEIKIY